MRHKNLGRKLGIRADHRKAQRRNMLTALFTYGRVVTTLAKAKEYRRHADKMVTLAKVKTLHRIRRAASLLGNDRDTVKRLFEVIGPMFAERAGGYTRILKLAKPRVGDNSTRAILELVGESERRAKDAEEKRALAAEKATKGKKGKKTPEKEAKEVKAARSGGDKTAKPGDDKPPKSGTKSGSKSGPKSGDQEKPDKS
jgi:large subunit ribosomal protein L17